MNSHILIPKCVLKKFAFNGGRLFYYDLKERRIVSGYAATLNTKDGYYSCEIEQFLSANIETPIGKLIAKLNSWYHDHSKKNVGDLVLDLENLQALKNYVYSLLVRSPMMAQQVSDQMVFSFLLNEQNLHDITCCDGFQFAQQSDFLKDFKLTFRFCMEGSDFLIPMQGYCSYMYVKTECVLIPLANNIAALYYRGNDIHENAAIFDKSYVDKINEFSLSQQMDKNFGFVASMNKSTIEETIARCNKNAKDEK